MGFHRRASMWIGILLLTAGTRSAQAQTAPASARPTATATAAPAAAREDAARAAAREAHIRGLEAREKGDWAAARAAFAEAWGHKRHWEIAVNLGEAEMKVGKYEEAIRHLTFALEERGFLDRSSDLVEEERKVVTGWVAEARRKLDAERAAAALRPKPAETPLSRTWLLGVSTGAGLTAASMVTGILLLAGASVKIDSVRASAESLPGEAGDPAQVRCQGPGAQVCKANVEQLRSADAMQAAGGVAMASAGVIAAATVVYVIFGSRRTGSLPVVSAAATGGAFGMAVTGSW